MILYSPYLEKTAYNEYRPVSGTDIHYSILYFLGQEPRKAEGVSLLQSAGHDQDTERALYWHVPHYTPQGGKPASAIRKGDFKLIYFYEDDRVELYNLAKDPEEQNDLS